LNKIVEFYLAVIWPCTYTKVLSFYLNYFFGKTVQYYSMGRSPGTTSIVDHR